jgi:hypothetical protein
MRNKTKTLFSFSEDDGDTTQEAFDRAEGVTYIPLDEASAVAMPTTIEHGWHELEYDKLAAEQEPLHTALGEKIARPFTVLAEQLKGRYEADGHAIDTQQDVVDTAKASMDLANDALEGHTRRESHAKLMYLLRWVLLVFGDVAGITGAAVLIGEIPYLAVMQAVASAIAAITAGLIGNDIRDARLARRRARDPKDLAPEHQKYAWVYSGADTGETIVKAMVSVAIVIALLIGAGIFTLRTGVEGSLAGAVFGCLAIAICLASALNSYNYTDEIADLLDHAYARYVRALKKLAKLSRSKAVARYNAALAEATSIKAEHVQLALAGGLHVGAFKYGISRGNPAVMGHGPAPALTAEPDLFTQLGRGMYGHTQNGHTQNGHTQNGHTQNRAPQNGARS